jgi:nucleoside-diphosphate-sugar epimerase/SAM-dependent methyltransferase
MNIAVIGSRGYIGSKILDVLSIDHNVTGYDILNSEEERGCNIKNIHSYDVVIYMCGLASRQECENEIFEKVVKMNVTDICSVAKKMKSSQILIYSLTTSIYEGNGSTMMEIVNEDKLDSYSKSMYMREMEISKLTNVKTIGLRFGTVIGISRSQRELVYHRMLKTAYYKKLINLKGSDCHRPILGLNDLINAIKHILKANVNKSNIYNLVSFNTQFYTIARSITDVIDNVKILEETSNLTGFSADNSAFSKDFSFSFEETHNSLIHDLIKNLLRPCRVCKGCNMKRVLDLGYQPIANNYLKEPCTQPTYPLLLTRCLDCSHTQQNYDTDYNELFSDYQYVSGTSKSLLNYFSWLSNYIIKETKLSHGTILEIACNDGSQLNEFYKKGWKTYGVDPAKNIVESIKHTNHDIKVGFWGVDTFDFPIPDVILAQNVCAHVPDPIKFLKSCRDSMDLSTTLYIQTSQCDMYENGEFDTIYHEHFSFFTINSMKKAAELSGLVITNIIKTPIHGNSFLFTMRKNETSICDYNVNFEEYADKIININKWVNDSILDFISKGYTIVAYGAAAKGMTLMNYFDIHTKIDYIVDDSPIKQGKFTPCSNVKIVSPKTLYTDERKLVILILAWNFSDEITNNIYTHRLHKDTFIIRPFPRQVISYVDFSE